MKFTVLMLAASMAVAWPLTTQAAGCQYDMQCKGERICQQGQCVYPDADDQADASGAKTATASPATKAPPPPPQRACCTVAGKLRLSPSSAADQSLAVGEACQGLTASGKPVPGTLCNQ